MDAIEKIADWLGEQPFARNRTDYTDEQRTFVEVDVEHLADCLIAAFPQFALEGREEWGHVLWGEVFPADDEEHARNAAALPPTGRVMRRVVFHSESPWSEVQS